VDLAKGGKLAEVLKIFKCKTPMFPNDWGVVVKAIDNETVPHAFEKMFRHHIQAMPVVDHDSGKLISLLYVSDLVSLVAKTFSNEDMDRFDTETVHKRDEIRNMTVTQLLDQRGRESVSIVSEDQTLLDAAFR